MIRIVSGTAKGRFLRTPKGRRTRPVIERVREAIFDILSEKVEGARVLDLFAGSGSLGIEALSRGAKEAVFVDSSLIAVATIRSNLKTLGFMDRSEILPGDSRKVIERLGRDNRKFDLIFSDPPYKKRMTKEILETLVAWDVLAGDGVVVTRCRRDEPWPEAVSGLVPIFKRIYGDALLALWGGTEYDTE
ncbi:MAG TPA: 16S rRNA (guanine(966)-N(2))-methyltransferase RsmD [Candidatus Latescibacteria bacterium]|nr:16S rRNA (guanine(966)-N(2))-methyltransferase RsmD [Candidatus Latescibacterota bacterium]